MLKRDPGESSPQRLLVLILIWLCFIFFDYLDVSKPARSVVEKLFVPTQVLIGKVVGELFRPLVYIQTAYSSGKNIVVLKHELSTAQSKIAKLQGYEAENKALKELFKNSQRNWEDSVISAPIMAFGSPAVTAGMNSGVKSGDIALSSGTIVGRVGKVSDYQAEILLLQNVSTPYLLAQTEKGVTGIIRGKGQHIVFTEVNKSSLVSNGELVMTLGQAGVPRNIPIGTIRTQSSTVAEPVLTFQLNQPVTFFESSIIEIISSGP